MKTSVWVMIVAGLGLVTSVEGRVEPKPKGSIGSAAPGLDMAPPADTAAGKLVLYFRRGDQVPAEPSFWTGVTSHVAKDGAGKMIATLDVAGYGATVTFEHAGRKKIDEKRTTGRTGLAIMLSDPVDKVWLSQFQTCASLFGSPASAEAYKKDTFWIYALFTKGGEDVARSLESFGENASPQIVMRGENLRQFSCGSGASKYLQ